MYKAIVTPVTIKPHPNADRLEIASVLGEQVVTGKGNFHTGDLVIYFPENGKLSNEYCTVNDLFPRLDDTGARIGGGYIDPANNRVRCQSFRGEKSYGLIMPLDSVAYTGVVPAELNRQYHLNGGYEFDELNDKPICEKFVRQINQINTRAGNVALRRDATYGGQFAMYFDTGSLYKTRPENIPQQPAIVTEKLHGTSGRYGRVAKQYTGLWGKVERVTDWLFSRDKFISIVGTRRTIVKAGKQGWYGDETWRVDVFAPWFPFLNNNEVVYGEIVGYTPDGGAIMSPHDWSKLQDKEFNKLAKMHAFTNPVVYNYGCDSRQCKFYVYRITKDGATLSWDDTKARCAELSKLSGEHLETVPELGIISCGTEGIIETARAMAEGVSTIGNHNREGVVLRFDGKEPVVLKAKSFAFLVMEGVASEKEASIEDLA